MKAKTRHWFIYQQPCFRFHIFAIHLIGVRIMPLAGRDESSVAMIEVGVVYFNPRAPRGARRARHAAAAPVGVISIHAPREGRDAQAPLQALHGHISIHAPREGRDALLPVLSSTMVYFNPRAPRGARLSGLCGFLPRKGHFNPRAPRGARPPSVSGFPKIFYISIHAPREGRDLLAFCIYR